MSSVQKQPPSLFGFLAVAAVGIGCAVYGFNEALRLKNLTDRLSVDQRTVNAEVVRSYEKRGYIGHYSITRYVDYRFLAGDVYMEGTASVRAEVWDQARQNGKIQVAYSGSDPRVNVPTANSPFYGSLAFAGVGIFGTGIVIYYYRKYRRGKAL